MKGLIEKDRAEQIAAVDVNDEEAIDTINYNIVCMENINVSL